MDPLLKLLRENAALTSAQLSKMLNLSEAEVAAKIKAYEKDQIILGYRTILNEEKLGVETVRAVIEVKITPERGGGFDRLAERIAKYSEVQSCYLMSGGYDLLVFVEGASLREVATCVRAKLPTIKGDMSNMTHRKPDSATPTGEPASAVRSLRHDPGGSCSLCLAKAGSSGLWPRVEIKRERAQMPWLGRWSGWGQKGWTWGRSKQGDPAGPERCSWPQGPKSRPMGVRASIVAVKRSNARGAKGRRKVEV